MQVETFGVIDVQVSRDHAAHPDRTGAIYDALVRALPFIADRPRERAAIVLITDGADTASDTSLHDLRPALVRSDAFVYAIAIDTPEPQAIASRLTATTDPNDLEMVPIVTSALR